MTTSADPIGYTYDADTHCPGCAIARFGQEPGRPWVRDDAADSGGNGVGVIAPWDEWCDTYRQTLQTLSCGTCGGVIAECDHRTGDADPDECECAECRASAEYAAGEGA